MQQKPWRSRICSASAISVFRIIRHWYLNILCLSVRCCSLPMTWMNTLTGEASITITMSWHRDRSARQTMRWSIISAIWMNVLTNRKSLISKRNLCGPAMAMRQTVFCIWFLLIVMTVWNWVMKEQMMRSKFPLLCRFTMQKIICLTALEMFWNRR